MRVIECSQYEHFVAADRLYQRVFGYGELARGLNANLLSAIVHNGGSAVGALDDDGELIGFAYGFAGSDGAARYHYSQAAVVDEQHQGRGIGRLLKQRQRLIALRAGERFMRWAFDPVLARNAHFNLSVLGARGVAFVEDFYGRPGTDRLVVEWPLDERDDPYAAARATAAPAAVRAAPLGSPVMTDEGTWIPIAAEPTMDAAEVSRLRTTLRALGETMTLISCVRVDARRSAYLAVHTELLHTELLHTEQGDSA